MQKDIHPPKVEDIGVAIVKEEIPDGEILWYAYLVNFKDVPIEGVLVSTRGYGIKNGEDVKTSVLRHFLDVIKAKSFAKIEPLPEDLFSIGNEFWVSFYQNKIMYDKKYVFVAESIREENFTLVPILNKRGVMIK